MVSDLINDVIANIDGFTGYKELLGLYLLVSSVNDLDGAIVEVGSWCGRSSVIIGKAANSDVFCIDLFPELENWKQNENGSWSIKMNGDTAYTRDFQIWDEAFEYRFKPSYQDSTRILDVFLKNIRRYGLEEKVKPLKGTVDTIALPFSSVKFAFIDGDHDYEAVYKDIKLLSELLVPKGIICVDDVRDDFVGVTKAVNELIIDNDEFTNVSKLTRKLLTATKRW